MPLKWAKAVSLRSRKNTTFPFMDAGIHHLLTFLRYTVFTSGGTCPSSCQILMQVMVKEHYPRLPYGDLDAQ